MCQNVSACPLSIVLGDLREKSFKIAWWPKGFFVQPAEAEPVTREQLQSQTKLNRTPCRMSEKRLFLPPFQCCSCVVNDFDIHVDLQH